MPVRIAIFNEKVLAVDIPEVAQTGPELVFGASKPWRPVGQISDPRDPTRRLRPRGERPRRRGGAAKRSDEIAPSHSITPSASASNVGGISTPIALAVFRLTIVMNFVACSIGRSPGLAPLRILSTK